jgi:hypothetical protein
MSQCEEHFQWFATLKLRDFAMTNFQNMLRDKFFGMIALRETEG